MVDELVAEGAEIAEKGPDFERHVGEVVPTRAAAVQAAQVADEDVHIERRDLGPESHTFIAKGDPIPAPLADLPRRPAAPAASRKK